jgi:chemotaxis protein methyltransferase WspC
MPDRTPPPVIASVSDPIADAAAHADRGDLARAAAMCEAHLERHGADARAWSLLGTIRQAEGDASRAESCFSRAIYCDPTHYAAMIQLALLFERRGDRDGAANLRRRAARVQGDGR